MNKVYFISDAHLGAQVEELEKQKTDRLLSFLELVKSDHAGLVICGDLFDFWFEYRHAIPRLHFSVLAKLRELVTAGLTIHYIAGNHDFWLHSFMENEIGLVLHPHDFIMNFNGQRIYIRHGDGLLKKDTFYRLLKKILRFPPYVFLYRLVHPDIGIPFALFCSHLSRESQKNQPNYADIEYRQFAYQKIEEGFDLVVLGHSHWPAVEKYKNGWYINPGTWLNPFYFAVITKNQPAIQQWDGRRGSLFSVTIPPGNSVK